MLKNWKQNTVYISVMQLTLLIVNFFLITIISREYGAETYGEYASSKSLSVLIGTAPDVTALAAASGLPATRTGGASATVAFPPTDEIFSGVDGAVVSIAVSVAMVE